MTDIDPSDAPHPSFLAALDSAPEITTRELGAIFETLTLQALRELDKLPDDLRSDDNFAILLGTWANGLAADQLDPIRRDPRATIVSVGDVRIQVAKLLEAVNDSLPVLQRSPLSMLFMVVGLVVAASPDATREQQAAGAVALLRQFEGWLPPQLEGLPPVNSILGSVGGIQADVLASIGKG